MKQKARKKDMNRKEIGQPPPGEVGGWQKMTVFVEKVFCNKLINYAVSIVYSNAENKS